MPSAYDLRYEQLRTITTEVHVDSCIDAETVVAKTGPPLFQPHPYTTTTPDLERKQSFRSENTDEDIRTIKAMIINNFKLFKTLTESIQEVSNTQNQMALLLKECLSIVNETNRILVKSVESTPSNPTTPRGIVSSNARPILSSRLPATSSIPIKKKIAISK